MSQTLLDLQVGLQAYLLGQSDRVPGRIESTATLTAERRLGIYRHAYQARLIELLADTYERVIVYIGDESFDLAARRYIENHTSRSRNLRDYGAMFPAFLADFFPHDPEVAELAEMDRRLRDTFDAPDADPLQLADVSALPPQVWETLSLSVHPSLTFQVFHWNTPEIWRHLNDEAVPPTAERLASPQAWLFWRKAQQPHFRSLAAEEHAALRALAAGHAFGAVCGQLAADYPTLDVAQYMGACLRTWLHEGVLRKPPLTGPA